MKKICENCKKQIKEREHFFEVIEFKEKKKIGTKYVHKDCQDKWNNQVNSQLGVNKKALDFIDNATNFMEQMGMKKVVIIP